MNSNEKATFLDYLLIFCVAVLCFLIFILNQEIKEVSSVSTKPTSKTAAVAETKPAVENTSSPVSAPMDSPMPSTDANPIQLASDSLVKQIITSYSKGLGQIPSETSKLLEELEQYDSQLAEAWTSILELWMHVNRESNVCTDSVPDVPSESLCIVTLGYHLNDDGSMSKELVGRCETALKCANAYPDAYVLVTGGGTAYRNPYATEADSMAEWLIDQGVDPDRILIENNSLTTSENAAYSYQVIQNAGLHFDNYIIVTSDYHIRRGYMVFQTQLKLSGDTGNVVGHAAWRTEHDCSPDISIQASEVRQVYTLFTR